MALLSLNNVKWGMVGLSRMMERGMQVEVTEAITIFWQSAWKQP
jgi:hypothetical protein